MPICISKSAFKSNNTTDETTIQSTTKTRGLNEGIDSQHHPPLQLTSPNTNTNSSSASSSPGSASSSNYSNDSVVANETSIASLEQQKHQHISGLVKSDLSSEHLYDNNSSVLPQHHIHLLDHLNNPNNSSNNKMNNNEEAMMMMLVTTAGGEENLSPTLPSNKQQPVLHFQVEIDESIKRQIDEKLRKCSSADSDDDVDSVHNIYMPKAVDVPSAQRLAKRLYFLDGFRASDVARHLSKK